MGFYSSKLENYSKSINLTPAQLVATKNSIIEQKKNYIEELKRSLQLSRRASLDGEYDYDQEYNSYVMAIKELEFIESMTTENFYQYMVSLENYNLTKIEDKAFTDMANNIKTRQKYKSQKGLVGKASALFGVDKKIIDKTSKMIDEENLTADFAQESIKEWQSTAPENQALYIVGRYEVDKKVNFDKENFDKYKLETFKKATEKFIEESEAGMGL